MARALVGCGVALAACARVEHAATVSDRAVKNIVTVPVPSARGLRENSAAAMSAKQPGVVFTITDSGNEPRLYAVDTTGAVRGVWEVSGATNVDWEAASIGPCGRESPSDCVYIGDSGDNNEALPSRTIYRVAEPAATGSGVRDTIVPEVLRYRYDAGSFDVEAMYVAPNGDIMLITKRPHRGAGRSLRPALVFSIPARAWNEKQQATAHLVDSVPIVPGSAPLRLVTDASLSPDHKHVVIRTYAEAYIFVTDSLTGRINHNAPPAVCDLVPLGEGQGEGVTWADAKGRLVFTSEGPPQIRLGTCDLRERLGARTQNQGSSAEGP